MCIDRRSKHALITQRTYICALAAHLSQVAAVNIFVDAQFLPGYRLVSV